MRLWPLLLISCASAPLPIRLGYNPVPAYLVAASQVSPSGIRFDDSDQHISGALLDRLVGEVETCLQKSIDRRSFVVKVPADWSLSCDGSQQILSSRAPDAGCIAKGEQPTPACPCRWRAVVQGPNVIVATPSLYLFKDALTRFVTGSQNPWADPALAKCAAPTTAPLSMGAQ